MLHEEALIHSHNRPLSLSLLLSLPRTHHVHLHPHRTEDRWIEEIGTHAEKVKQSNENDICSGGMRTELKTTKTRIQTQNGHIAAKTNPNIM